MPGPPIDRIVRPVKTMLNRTYPTIAFGGLPIVAPLCGAYGAEDLPHPKHAPHAKER